MILKMGKTPSNRLLPFYGRFYSDTKLIDKITKVAKKAGVKAVYAALLLYYALMDKNVSLKDKAIVLGALGYFIFPADLLPDLGPIGYTDDLGAMILALKAIWDAITPATHAKARARLETWFGKVEDAELKLF